MRTAADKVITALIRAYVWLVSKTARIDVKNVQDILPGRIIGYWHEDSQGMLVLLRRYSTLLEDVMVIITADWRGNMLEGALEASGAKALRVSDGLGARHAMAAMKEACAVPQRVLATAADGPTGPRHEPKLLLFHLAAQQQREMIFVRYRYKGAIRLKRRWDHYAIPLPFCRMDIEIVPLGAITREKSKVPAVLMKECGILSDE